MLKTLSAVRSLVSDQDENESFVYVNKYLNFGEKQANSAGEAVCNNHKGLVKRSIYYLCDC